MQGVATLYLSFQLISPLTTACFIEVLTTAELLPVSWHFSIMCAHTVSVPSKYSWLCQKQTSYSIGSFYGNIQCQEKRKKCLQTYTQTCTYILISLHPSFLLCRLLYYFLRKSLITSFVLAECCFHITR